VINNYWDLKCIGADGVDRISKIAGEEVDPLAGYSKNRNTNFETFT
jgi:hypothetical protein